MNSICPHFGVCGGCSSQDKPYSEQLHIKEELVRDHLKELQVGSFHPIVPSPETTFYRNKMEFSFGDERDIEILNRPKFPRGKKPPLESKPGGAVHLGLHPRKRFSLVTPTPDCRLLSEESQVICKVVSDWATRFGIHTYTRHNQEGTLRHLVIREAKNTGQRSVNLFTKTNLEHLDELTDDLKNSKAPITTFMWTGYDGQSDVATSPPTKILWGEGKIEEKVEGISIDAPFNSFMQTNTHASEGMIALLKKWNAESSDFPVLIDLYCGVGTIGLNLVKPGQALFGIEVIEPAVEQAKKNAEANKIEGAQFLAGRVEKCLDQLKAVKNIEQARLVVDPPRAGLHADVLDLLLQSKIPEIYYVSCNPASLSRDLQGLQAKYKITDVVPMDFFPHTDHVETAVRLKILS